MHTRAARAQTPEAMPIPIIPPPITTLRGMSLSIPRVAAVAYE